MSRRFKLVLFVRFLGYFIFFIGLVSFVFVFGPLIQVEAQYRYRQVFNIKKTVAENPVQTGDGSDNSGASTFGSVASKENTITPVSTDYGIVIEKIDANARVIPNVDPANEGQYLAALSKGVAEAAGSTPPGQPGNLYLFSHSTDAPWNIVRYNAIFYLLRELQPGDKVLIFYQNRRYDYVVFDKTITDPSNTSFLTNRYDQPVLTLQTCDPPGTLLNRLIVRAKLVKS